ncbi:CBS domain-containing protein [Spongiivirga citrea]|uniref:CBS domain-containing protein n=1 Tax=Spongiivirga citrea TaxID=1481457 RepID=A0A6M0CJL7_9FLAO|nr:CBS domain-containing protein [Spongiivirga citrea]NER18138.1 CBS domain-containing protein [Spongiivirga citrea]
MEINQLISKRIHPLNLQTPISQVHQLFNQLTYSHIPVTDNAVLLGAVFEDDAKNYDKGKELGDYQYELDLFYVNEHTNWLDVIEAFAKNESNIMPVLDRENRYVGYYELTEILDLFNNTPFLSEPGGILVVEKGLKDYSFSEIAQIVESNNGKLLGAFISETKDDMVQITIKLNNSNLNEVLQTFRRYSYNVIFGNDDDVFIDTLKDRSDYLDRYLNI